MKHLLIDYTPHTFTNFSLTESKISGDGRMRIRGKLQEAEVKNGNGRVYPKQILEKQIQKYIEEAVNKNTAMGELDHPESSVINLNNVSHHITKIWWENNAVMGELLLLNTPAGKIAQELISARIPLGISSRGMGSVRQIGETVEVQDDFELLAWDLVSVPSTPDAYMYSMNEGSSNGEKQKQPFRDYSKVNQLITEIICNQIGVCPLCP